MTWNHLSFWKSKSWKNIKYTLATEVGITPSAKNVLAPLIHTPLNRTKVVMLGKEPYALKGLIKSDGLAYSYETRYGKYFDPKVEVPDIWRNLVDEAKDDVGIKDPKHGSLRPWADQGVLLLNTRLTAKVGHPNSHLHLGWADLVAEVIETVWLNNSNAVFILPGEEAQGYDVVLPISAHVIRTANPGPLTANEGWFGSAPFSRTNAILKRTRQRPVYWELE